MRYSSIRNIEFTRNLARQTQFIKDLRIFRLLFGREIRRPVGKDLDSLAVEFYGQGREAEWFRVAEANADKIIGWNADMENINILRTPVRV